MTRKDYVRIAEVLRKGRADEALVDGFVHMFQADNARFDAARFRASCKG